MFLQRHRPQPGAHRIKRKIRAVERGLPKTNTHRPKIKPHRRLRRLQKALLGNAVYLARKYLDAERIALFSEVPFEHDNLPGIGEISVNLDYITSAYAGVKDIGTGSNAQVRLKTPYLLVVEAKSSDNQQVLFFLPIDYTIGYR